VSDWPAKKNAAFELQFPVYDADGDLVSAAASLDTEVSKDGGTFVDATNEATEIATSSGCYKVSMTATEMNADRVMTITKTATAGAKTAVNLMYTATRQLVDLAYPATSGRSFIVETDGMVHGDLKEWLGVAPLALVSQRVNSSVGAMAANVLNAAAIAANAITAAKFGAGAIDAAAIATGAIDADALAADAATELRSLLTGTADAGGSSTTMVDAARTEADDVHVGNWILFTSGAVANQVRLITDFVAATDTMTFAPAATASIGAGITYEILPAGAVDLQSWLGVVGGLVAPSALVSGRVDASVGAMAANVLDAAAIAASAITSAKFAAGAINNAAIATDAISATKIATDAIGASELAADAANEIADAVLKRDIDQVEATAPKHSLTTAILKAVARIRDNAGTLEIYETDGVTIHASQTVTVDAGLDPIDELTGAV
jgi:hypothetical protein